MTELLSKILIFTAFLCVYIYGTKGRPFNFEDVTTEDQNKFEESDLLKRSKTNSGEEGKGPKENKGNKKQVIDAYHLGPYHHGHPWGTVSQWPGYHWGGHPTRHSGWTGYPSMGGWHKSHISKKNSKKSAHKAALKRHMLPTFSYPSYGFAYPSLGFAAVPFTPSPNPWGYEGYRSKLPAKTSKGQTRSSVKGTEAANKRWWPGYMGGWGGWGLGNEGYPGWSPLGDWGHGYDFGGFGHGWGIGFENSFHPFLRAEIPGKHVEKGEAQKRWWPGYMGGWGGWGLGNGGYPGWGPLGDAWGHGLGSYGYGHGLGLGYGYGHGLGLGYGYARGFHSGKEDDKDKAGPKREFIHQPFGGLDYPWDGYGPFADHDYPFLGHDQYLPYPEALYGDFMPFYGFGLGPYAAGPFGYGGHGFYGGHGSYGGYGSYGGHGLHGGHGFFKSKIPNGKSKKMQKELKKEEEASGRHFIHNFNPGRMGWGGAIYPGHGYHGVFPLLAAHPYGTYGGGFYGPYGPPHGAFGPYHRSNVPVNTEESSQSRQVINYNPGCCGWGGCVYPGCGYIGGWTWPLPCHHHHCGCCPCWTRSKAPKTQELKEEKGKSRQEIESPGEGESNEGKPGDQQTHPHLEGSDLMNSEMQNLAMGFPGIEKLQTPMNLAGNQETQRFSDQEMETDGEQQSSPEPAEATQNIAGMTGITPDIGGNGFRTATLGNMEEQQEGQPQSTEDLMSSFNLNMNPSAQGEAPVESFGETGNPGMYPTGAEEQATETASRRADIPGELIKKQAVAYPYHYLYPYSMMTHGINPYYHYAPINYAQHLTTYPTTYPLTHAGFIPQTLPALPAYHGHPSHSIHVGAPNVNVDVHTTREHVAHNPEKQKGGKLKDLVGEFSEKLKLKHKHGQSSHGKKVTKRQIPSFMSPAINRPMGYGAPLRYPIPNTAGLMGQSMLPSLQQPQPFDMNAMSRSGFPAMQSSVMGPSPLRLAAIRTPQMRSALTPSQMAFSRQLSGITGISLPFSAQPGMGIVGMASRKKRSSKKKHSKKHNNSTKRQFLAAMPQGFPGGEFPGGAFPGGAFPGGAFPGGAFPGGAFPGGAFPGGAFPGGAFPAGAYPSFALPASPFAGAALPAFPYPLAQSLVQPQQQQQQQQKQQQQPLTFKSGALPAFRAKMAPAGLSQMKSGGILGAPRMPMLSPYSGFTSEPNNPFVKVPQFQNANFFSGSPSSPWAPSAPMRESMSGFPQAPEGNQGPMMPEMPQQGEEPFQMNGEQVAGFNPSSIGLGGGPQPSPMFPEGGPEPGSEGPAPLAMGPPQREMASFYQYRGAGMMESPRYMQPGLAALKKSAVPSKKHNKGKNSKSRTKIPS